ncbi:MAG: methionine adenosyltransferase [Clostridia bacterium]|nr:methionine adenosyltransferase [Clostridia bacterium]
MERKIITAESVTSGHPDKLCDLIADAILDECLSQDENSRVACEVVLAHDKCLIAGEVTTDAEIDYAEIAKEVISAVGYEAEKLEYEIRVVEQSGDIAQAVDKEKQGAGDQGIVFGYATRETENYMPLCSELANRLVLRLEECRAFGEIGGLLPDGKTQVSVEYKDGKFERIVSIVVSAQHKEGKDIGTLRREIKNKVIDRALIGYDLTETEILINPSGRFVKGGYEADTGLTGRKIIADSYGGAAHHGGGAYSGKDASKVDRSGAYMARYVAKNIVAAGLSEKCEVAISYAIGKAEPTAINIDTFGTASIDEERILSAVKEVFDFTPKGIIETLDLKQPVFSQTSVGGHFGKDYLMWELTNKAVELKEKTAN